MNRAARHSGARTPGQLLPPPHSPLPLSVSAQIKHLQPKVRLSAKITQGQAETQQLKQRVRQKGLNKHTTYPDLLHQAYRHPPTRLLKILDCMVNDARQGLSLKCPAAVLDQCVLHVLGGILSQGRTAPLSVSFLEKAAYCLEEISWRTRRRPQTPWTLLFLVARGQNSPEGREYARARALLDLSQLKDTPLLVEVLESPQCTAQIANDLYQAINTPAVRAKGGTPMDRTLSTAFYSSTTILSEHLLAYEDTALTLLSVGHFSASVIKTLLCLAHFHATKGNFAQLDECLRFMRAATEAAEGVAWPIPTVAAAIQKMCSICPAHMTAAVGLLEALIKRDHVLLAHLINDMPVFRDTPALRVQLIGDNSVGWGKPLERDAWWGGLRVRLRMSDPGMHDLITQFCRHGCHDNTNAGSLARRLRSAQPIDILVREMAAKNHAIDLSELTRLLYVPGPLPSSSSSASASASLTIGYTDKNAVNNPLGGFALTRAILLREDLAALALHSEQQPLLLSVLPHMPLRPPSPASSAVLSHAYYLATLNALQAHPRILLHFLRHLVSHPSSSSYFTPVMLQSLVTKALQVYVDGGHFHNQGYFRLERLLVHTIPVLNGFPRWYQNQLWPRLWALHMFLRRRRYVPRYTLYRWQFGIHKHKVYRMRQTAIPSKQKLKDKKVDMMVMPLRKEDIGVVRQILFDSMVRRTPSDERYSLEWMLEKQTQIVS
ncbi:hypothetical protein BX661DRAFT_188399 [Kickxella alabastrina]|uniref:uncharacterized protein n=1 Tax=Kickxella alabastrina TaxID=61397 RepID=UPI00222104BD|nr:uncharacterized protein BX661DRAFT_188399 [Kickxella alabastrina]KAI7821487.1 hypothetical protein BX661DRAFT_188399 [Kickxella alabastrina]